MKAPEAEEKLRRMILADEDPALADNQVTDLLELAQRPDADGFTALDGAAWTPTWDLNYAAAEGWRRKAGIAAGRFNFTEDGQAFQRAQVYAHCVSQAEEYARKGMGAIPVQGESSYSTSGSFGA